MRCAAFALLIATGFTGTPHSGAQAQSIVDLSKPQTGKSRFVLNSDMTPADLGVREPQKPAPVAAVSGAPACGEGCKLEQPDVPRETRRYGYRDEPASSRTRSGTHVVLIGNFNGNRTQQIAAKPAPAPRKTFRFRRR